MEPHSKRYFIEATIVSHCISESKSFPYSKFIDYEIMLSTKNKIWTIFRRYSQFEKLHQKLLNEHKNLPTLPKKKFFNFSDSVIEERKKGLQNYLNQIFHIINFYTNNDLLEFIEIEKEEVLYFMTSKTLTFNRQDNPKFSIINNSSISKTYKSFLEKSIRKISLRNSSDEDDDNNKLDTISEQVDERQVVSDFLDKLENQSGDKTKAVDEFIAFLKKKDSNNCYPKLKKEDIWRLLFGDLSDHKGLIYHCGTIEENRLGAEACINLFGKLISFDFNPDCETYIQICTKMTLNQFRKMKLNEHIENDNKEACFKILNLLLKEDKYNIFKQLVDESAEEKYKTWSVNSLCSL